MNEFIDKYLSSTFQMEGLEIKGTIPINDELINDFLHESLSNIQSGENKESKKLDSKYLDLLQYLRVKAQSKEGRVDILIHLRVDG